MLFRSLALPPDDICMCGVKGAGAYVQRILTPAGKTVRLQIPTPAKPLLNTCTYSSLVSSPRAQGLGGPALRRGVGVWLAQGSRSALPGTPVIAAHCPCVACARWREFRKEAVRAARALA